MAPVTSKYCCRIYPKPLWRRNAQDVFMADWSKSVDVWVCPTVRAVELYVDCTRHSGRVSRSYLRSSGFGLHGIGWLLGSLFHRHVPVHVSVSNRLRVDGSLNF